jgi:hypothetical protein
MSAKISHEITKTKLNGLNRIIKHTFKVLTEIVKKLVVNFSLNRNYCIYFHEKCFHDEKMYNYSYVISVKW